jgi:hypothetical protein
MAANDVEFVSKQYDKALAASEVDRTEAARMRDLYTGFGKGQWSTDAKNRLQSRGSIVPQINLSRGKIKRLAGSLVKNFFDVSFIPVSNEQTEMTRLLNDLYLSDANAFDYTKSYLLCVINSLIHQGVEQMITSTRHNPLGNITFESVLPGHVIIDPNWKSDNPWDINEVFKIAYLTPQQIIDTYGFKNDRIKQLLDIIELNGEDYDSDSENKSTAHIGLDSSYGHKYRIIERHFLETRTRVVKFALVEGELIDLPEDEAAAQEKLADNNLQDKVQETITRRVQDKIYRIQTCCRELDQFKLLEDAESDIQIGRLPFFPVSSERFCGTNSGVMSLLEDVQKMINSREAQTDDIIATHSSGAYLFDPILVANNDILANQVMQDMKRPDAIIKTAPGMLASGRDLIKPISRDPFPGELYKEIERMSNYFDALSGQTATLDGTRESSHDTGTLFARRAMQSEIALTMLTKSLESHQRDKAEAWMLYAKVLYSGAYREVGANSADAKAPKEPVELNAREYKEDGSVETKNDLSQLPRHKVVVIPSKDGVTVRETDRSRNLELLQYVQSPIKRVILENNAIKTLDNSAEEKAELDKYYELEMATTVARMEAELAQLQASIEQTKAQTQQIGAQAGALEGQAQASQAEAEAVQAETAQAQEAPAETVTQ